MTVISILMLVNGFFKYHQHQRSCDSFEKRINSLTMAANVINLHDPSLKSPSDNIANDDMNSEIKW